MAYKLTIEINGNNAAFYLEDGETINAGEYARILREVADEIEHSFIPLNYKAMLRDINGNCCGCVVLEYD